MPFTPIPTVPPYTGEAPNRNTQQQTEFSANFDDSLLYQTTLSDDINATTVAISTVATEVEAIAGQSQSSADSSEVSNQESEASAVEASHSAAKAASNIEDLIIKSSGGKLVGHTDLNGNVNVFYRIPVFSYEDIGMSAKMGTGVVSAFLKPDGINFYSELLVAVTPMSLVGTDAVSIPGLEPLYSKTFDEMRAYAVSAGYHLMTSHDWAAVALWCEANGFQPKGNTNYGRSYDDLMLSAVRPDGYLPGDSGGAARTLGASGPAEWSHNGQDFGIADLVGNVWEWVDGFKISEGQVVASEHNLDDESNWVAQECFFDAGNKLNSSKTADLTNGSVTWSAIGKDASYESNQLMKRMMIEPDDATTLVGRCYYNNTGERSPLRGGSWGGGADAGLGALSLRYERSTRNDSISGRFALLR